MALLASIREWLGASHITQLSASGYEIADKDFEQTVAVPRNDVEDDDVI